MKKLVFLPILALLGCAEPSSFSPTDMDFSSLEIRSEDEAFDVFVDTAYSIAVAESLVEECGEFGVDGREADFAQAAVSGKLGEFFAGDEAASRAFAFRLTEDATARNWENSDGLSQEIKVILTDRLYTYFRERGALVGEDFGDFTCSAAEVEKQTGSLIGRFLYRK